jgi:NADPH-dependent ferric siderophore reductase
LLAGDETAVPAISRRLDELPAGVRAIVIVKLAAEDRRTFFSRAQFDVRWIEADASLADAIRDLALPQGEGFAWCAGEAAEMARVRDVLLAGKGHPKEAARISAYWKAGVSEFHEDLG